MSHGQPPVHRQESPPSERPPLSTTCPVCGAATDAGAHFCRDCGAKIAAPATEDAAKLQPAPSTGAQAPPIDRRDHSPSQVSCVRVTTPEFNGGATQSSRPDDSSARACSCGRALPADALFCAGCGTPVGRRTSGLCLVQLTEGEPRGVRAPLAGGVIIGKTPECDLILADDDFVSRRHARVSEHDGEVTVEDLGSSNGTFVRLRRRFTLEPGDELLIGRSAFRLEADTATPQGQMG